jgi:hypothetical protein
LSLHKPTGQYYSIPKTGQRTYWGADRIDAIDRYRESLNLGPFRKLTNAEALERLDWEDVNEEQATPDLIAMAKRNRLAVNNDWLASNPLHPIILRAA